MENDPRSSATSAPRVFPGGAVKLPRIGGSSVAESPDVDIVRTAFGAYKGDGPPSAPTGRFTDYFTADSLFEDRTRIAGHVPDLDEDYLMWHEILQVEPGAAWEEIAAAHRRLAKLYHPDRFVEADAADRRRAEDAMCEVNSAYQGLRDARRPAAP